MDEFATPSTDTVKWVQKMVVISRWDLPALIIPLPLEDGSV